MRTFFVWPLGVAVLAATANVARPQTAPPSCYGTQRPKQVAELLFGRDVGGRLGVSEAAWGRFLAREITPRFPDGLTVMDAAGQWRDPTTGAIEREPSKRVEIVLPGKADDQAQLEAIVECLQAPVPPALGRYHRAAGLRCILIFAGACGPRCRLPNFDDGAEVIGDADADETVHG